MTNNTYQLSLQNMLKAFESGVTHGDPRMARKLMQQEFIDMMNSQFGTGGLFFSAEEEDGTDTEKPLILSLHHDRKFERIGVLDTKDKYLLDFCDTAIKRYKTVIIETKKELIEVRRAYVIATDEYNTLRKNFFNRLFRRKAITTAKVKLDIKEKIFKKKEEYLDVMEHSLILELAIKDKVQVLMNQLNVLGFENESA